MDLDFSGDFDVFDNHGDVSLQSREGGDPQTVSAIRRWITAQEAAASEGKYTTDDATFHISSVGLNKSPKLGDTITEEGDSWTVLTVRFERLTKRYELICRELKVTDLITIQKATYSKSADGIQEPSWSDEHTDLPAEIQVVSGADQTENKLQEVKPTLVAYLNRTIETKNRRVVHAEKNYRIKGHRNSDRIDRLFELTLEEW